MAKNDYISRKAAVAALMKIALQVRNKYTGAVAKCIVAVDLLPAADAESVRHGRWVDICGNYTCSECEYMWEDSGYKTPFCPNCGAKMDLEGQND